MSRLATRICGNGLEEQSMALSGLVAEVQGGGYISLYKLVPVLLVLMVWARLLTWADKDAPELQLPREKLNLPLFGGMILGFALFLIVPNFFLAFGVLLICFGAEVGIYLNIRKKKADFADLKVQFMEWLKSSLRGKQMEKKPEVEAGQVAIISKTGAPTLPPDKKDPERAVYDAMQTALAEPLKKSAEQIELAPETEGVATKYVVDGVVYRGAVLTTALGASLISSLKAAAGLALDEVRKPQSGSFKVVLDGKRRELDAELAGTRGRVHAHHRRSQEEGRCHSEQHGFDRAATGIHQGTDRRQQGNCDRQCAQGAGNDQRALCHPPQPRCLH